MSDKVLKTVTLLTGVIFIWIVVKIVEFIEAMPQCSCGIPTKTLERIAFLEKIVIAIIGINVLYQFFSTNTVGDMNSIWQRILLVISFAVYVFFIYNVNEFRTSIGKNCECADKWEKIALYIQALLYAVVIALFVASSLFLLSMGFLNVKTPMGINILLILFTIVAIFAWSLLGGNTNDLLDYVMEHTQKEGFECGCNSDKKKI